MYSVGLPSVKRDVARKLIQQHPCISPQVVMETVNVLIKKFKFEKSDAFESALGIMDSAALKIITADTLMRAFEIGLRYKLSTLYSEDMQHG